MTTLLVSFALVFKFFVHVLGKCPFCWNTQFIYETIDLGPDKGPDKYRTPDREVTKNIICGKCHRTLTSKKQRASKHSP